MGLIADFKAKHPHLYTCSVCEAKVCVTPMGEGVEPIIARTCEHDGATVWANRAVTLYDKSTMSVVQKAEAKVRLTLRQFLSWILGRSV